MSLPGNSLHPGLLAVAQRAGLTKRLMDRWSSARPSNFDAMAATLDIGPLDEATGLLSHHPIGVSTGIFAGDRGRWPRLVDDACGISSYVVELSALSGGELPGLLSYLGSGPALPFRYLSVHAPAKNFDERVAVDQLCELPLAVRSVVLHPDVIVDVALWKRLKTRAVIENMDDRKKGGRTVDELKPIFKALPEAGFCFDVAHAWSLDPTMELAHSLLDQFRASLRQVHLSSLDSAGHHIPLRREDAQLFTDVLSRCTDVPWILEAMPPAGWV